MDFSKETQSANPLLALRQAAECATVACSRHPAIIAMKFWTLMARSLGVAGRENMVLDMSILISNMPQIRYLNKTQAKVAEIT